MLRRLRSKGFRGTILSDNYHNAPAGAFRGKGITNMTGERAADWFA